MGEGTLEHKTECKHVHDVDPEVQSVTREAIAASVSRSPVFSMKSILPVNKIYLSFLLAESCVGSCSVVLKDVL